MTLDESLRFDADRIRFLRTLDRLRFAVQNIGCCSHEEKNRMTEELLALAPALTGLDVDEFEIWHPWPLAYPLTPEAEAMLRRWLRYITNLRAEVEALEGPEDTAGQPDTQTDTRKKRKKTGPRKKGVYPGRTHQTSPQLLRVP